VVGYGPFSFCVIHKEGLCPSYDGINTLMTMIKAADVPFDLDFMKGYLAVFHYHYHR
jgi:hypothetical protein